jgi:diacylglycerol O-acyltransferase / wax synthase
VTNPPEPGRRTRNSRYVRLNGFERMYLRGESEAWPGHYGGLAVLEPGALVDDSGRLRIEEIGKRLDRRLSRVPELRRRVYVPGRLRGRPLWVDDERFAIENHLKQIAVPAPGDEGRFLDTAADLYGRLIDRRHPLWELWFLTGLEDGRLGVMLKLHHAVADGSAAVRIMGSLFDFVPDAPDPPQASWNPCPLPGGWTLFVDNLGSSLRRLGRWAGTVAHPGRIVGALRVLRAVMKKSFGATMAPVTSLNRPVLAGRRIRFNRGDLDKMKRIAHAHGGKVNDVVLALWAGGLRDLMVSRGEPVEGVELNAGQAVSIRSAADSTIDNQVGTAVVPLPVWEPDVGRRLDLTVATTARATTVQPAAIMGALVGIAATPVGRWFVLHQRATNVVVTNLPGPPVPVYVLGSRILDIFPIIDLEGNVGLVLCAFSYAGRMSLVVTADATGFPDLDVLMAGMEREWEHLSGEGAVLSALSDIAAPADDRGE